MDKISIFNYEAYYLDYLEGNLNEEDTALLLAFLEEYPECKLVDEALPEVNIEESPVFLNKESLKMVDEEGAIKLNNVDHFLIASNEGLLSVEKEKELSGFVAKEGLEDEAALYGSVQLIPDTKEVYVNKAGLKQKEVFVLWPYIATAAAACVIVILMLWQGNADIIDAPQNIADEVAPKDVIEKDQTPYNDQTQVYQASVDDQSSAPVRTVANKPTADQQSGQVDQITHRKARPILSNVGDLKLVPLASANLSSELPQEDVARSSDYASIDFADMANPIEPITKLINNRTNTEVDFRRRKASKKKGGGFFVKVGKFELSRKTHKKR